VLIQRWLGSSYNRSGGSARPTAGACYHSPMVLTLILQQELVLILQRWLSSSYNRNLCLSFSGGYAHPTTGACDHSPVEVTLLLQQWLYAHPTIGTCAHPSAVITLILQQDPALAGANLPV
jgi:hypothetical protein